MTTLYLLCRYRHIILTTDGRRHRQPCQPIFSLLDSTFRYAGVYTAVCHNDSMSSCRQNLLNILVYMDTWGHYVCMTTYDGMSAHDGYRGIHASVTESGVKIIQSK